MRIVVALGGNAIMPRAGSGTVTEQRSAIRSATDSLASLVAEGHELVLTHGNGPQIGRLLAQEEALPSHVPAYPMDVLVAETQGQLGYLVQQELVASLKRARAERPVVTLITQVVVDPADPAFTRPTKPVGPVLHGEGAAALRAHAEVVEVSGGVRRVVPSPAPVALVEAQAVRAAVDSGVVPIAAGGGGVPVVREGNATRGVEAVVDKDLTAALLRRVVQAEVLLILTDVERVQRRFGTPQAEPIARIGVAEVRSGIASGEFPVGSMGPKLAAAASAVEEGARAIVASLDRVNAALAGESGTEIVP